MATKDDFGDKSAGRDMADLGRRKKHYHGYLWTVVVASAVLGGGAGLFVLVCSLGAALLNPALHGSPWRWPIGILGSLLGAGLIAGAVVLCQFLYRSGPDFDLHERGAVFRRGGRVTAFRWTEVIKVRVNMAVSRSAAETAGSRLLIEFHESSSRQAREVELRSAYFPVKYLLEILKRLSAQVGPDRIEEREWT